MAAPGTKDSEIIADVDVATPVSISMPIAELVEDVGNAVTNNNTDVLDKSMETMEDVGNAVANIDRSMQMEAHDWHNRVRGAVLVLVSEIPVPVVGAVASMLIGFFWPANKVDIWVALNAEEYVRNIVKREIFALEMRQFQSEVQALELTVSRYHRAVLGEKGGFLIVWISQADRLCLLMRNSTNNIHLLLHIVTVSVLHMAAMHERLTFGKELYGTSNTENWTKDLEDVCHMYVNDIIPNIYKKWKQWRETQIEIKAWVVPGVWGNVTMIRQPVSHATVEDKVSGQKESFQRVGVSSTTIFSSVCQYHKTRMLTQAVLDMDTCLSPTLSFPELIPPSAVEDWLNQHNVT